MVNSVVKRTWLFLFCILVQEVCAFGCNFFERSGEALTQLHNLDNQLKDDLHLATFQYYDRTLRIQIATDADRDAVEGLCEEAKQPQFAKDYEPQRSKLTTNSLTEHVLRKSFVIKDGNIVVAAFIVTGYWFYASGKTSRPRGEVVESIYVADAVGDARYFKEPVGVATDPGYSSATTYRQPFLNEFVNRVLSQSLDFRELGRFKLHVSVYGHAENYVSNRLREHGFGILPTPEGELPGHHRLYFPKRRDGGGDANPIEVKDPGAYEPVGAF